LSESLSETVIIDMVFDIEEESPRLDSADPNDQCTKHDYTLPCSAVLALSQF
jgi:hypothetical protein